MAESGFDTLLVRGAGAAVAVGALWMLAILVSAALEALTSGRLALTRRLGCPAALSAWLVVTLSVLLLGNQAATARGGIEPPARSVDGLPIPSRTLDPPQRRSAPVLASVTVRTGDSLWRIARRALQPLGTARPGDAEIAASVRALYAANRAVIGADPDLLRPGQVLRLPQDSPQDFPTR